MISPLLVALVDELALLAVALVLVVEVQVVAAAELLLPLLFLLVLVLLVLQLFPCCLRGCERKRLRKRGEGGDSGASPRTTRRSTVPHMKHDHVSTWKEEVMHAHKKGKPVPFTSFPTL